MAQLAEDPSAKWKTGPRFARSFSPAVCAPRIGLNVCRTRISQSVTAGSQGARKLCDDFSPTGQRYLTKLYPKDNEPRTFGVRQAWLDAIAAHIQTHGIGHDDLLFATKAGTPISRNTFRTRIWLPAVKASGVDFPVRVYDLRHAHASWLLAGGADLMSVMERMGHAQIQTTQKYLHTFLDTDQRNLGALSRVQHRDQ